MTPEQEEAVLANAKYLRGRRPIDPDEIRTYVPGQPPAPAVQAVLRGHTFDLGLVEHPDGRFDAVPDEPPRITGITVDALPAAYADRLEHLLADAYGPGWARGDTGDQLRRVIRKLKDAYYRQQRVEYTTDAAHAYALYHLPGYYAAIQYVLEDLTSRGLIGPQVRVADIGAGVGGPGLGLHDLLFGPPNHPPTGTEPPESGFLVDYHAVEPSPAADLAGQLLAPTDPNFHVTIHRETGEAFDPPGPVDLVLFVNVLSEVTDPVALVRRAAAWLPDDGAIVACAPADRETSIGLRSIERTIVDGLSVYSPTLRLWPGHHPRGRCWSFDERPDLTIPGFQRALDNPAGATGEFVNVDVKYSYVILRRDDTTRIEFRPDPNRLRPLAASHDHVTDRIDCAAVKLSRNLGDDNPLYLVGDGSEDTDHFAVLARATTGNRPLAAADYGEVLLFERVLVLWNDDERAYNLVADAQTTVTRITP